MDIKHREDTTAQHRDLTTGSLHRDIWYLAPPMMLETGITNVVQILDTYWVAQLGSEALAAVTISITIRWVINSLANGLGIGGLAVVARRIGARDRAAADHAATQTLLLGIVFSIILGLLGLAVARPLLILLGADTEVLPLGLAYLRVALAGIFTLILVFVLNSILRGAGEARKAMAVLFLSTTTIVVLEPLLIFGLGPIPALGVIGSAWANVLGYGTGVAIQLVILFSGRARIGMSLKSLKPDFPLMGRIISIALPSTIQMTLRSSSRLVILGLVGIYGTYATAGYGVANRLLLVALIPIFGLGNATATLVGQNLGAGKPERAGRIAWWVSAYAAGFMIAAALLLFSLANPLISLFDPTPQVVVFGTECLRVVSFSLISSAVGVTLARGFDGAGNTVPAMAINLLTLWGMEIPFAYGLSRWLALGILGVWWGRTIANVANGLFFFIWFRRGRWKLRQV
ncbi:MAG TPA: MATE family efflux transporter [Anaerolineae bacterium]|nr:MATE family efflux transporter [Anaerolineae bacterium]